MLRDVCSQIASSVIYCLSIFQSVMDEQLGEIHHLLDKTVQGIFQFSKCLVIANNIFIFLN